MPAVVPPFVDIARLVDVVPPAVSVRVVCRRESPGPLRTLGVIETERLTVPAKPERLVALIVTLPPLPLIMERVDGLALSEKSGELVLVKFASRMSSGTTSFAIAPFTTVTHIESLLEPLQPTGNRTYEPWVLPTML